MKEETNKTGKTTEEIRDDEKFIKDKPVKPKSLQEMKKEMKDEIKREIKEEQEKKERKYWFYPTKNIIVFFEIILVLGLMIGFLNFPLSSFMGGRTDVSIEFGYPFSFFSMDLQNVSKIPLNIWGFIFDVLIYFAIAYVLDMSIDLLFKKKKKNKKPEEKPLEEDEKKNTDNEEAKKISNKNSQVVKKSEEEKKPTFKIELKKREEKK